jgi:hypothetical protein
MKVLLIALILGILFIVSYIIFIKVYKPWSISSIVLEPDDTSLDIDKQYPFVPKIVDNNPTLTFTFYVRPDSYNRTGNASTDVIYPIFGWTELFTFGIVPGGASAAKDKNTGTVFQIKNTGGTSDPNEKIKCPDLPLQKWTYVAITIEGRRIDIFYNGRVAASHMLETLPNYAGAQTGTLRSGSGNLKGRIGLVGLNPRRMNAEEIMIDYVSSSDTRGRPYFGSIIPFIGNLFSCPAGAFCMKPNAAPKPGVVAWYSPFE